VNLFECYVHYNKKNNIQHQGVNYKTYRTTGINGGGTKPGIQMYKLTLQYVLINYSEFYLFVIYIIMVYFAKFS
jgi:hypothetical protein